MMNSERILSISYVHNGLSQAIKKYFENMKVMVCDVPFDHITSTDMKGTTAYKVLKILGLDMVCTFGDILREHCDFSIDFVANTDIVFIRKQCEELSKFCLILCSSKYSNEIKTFEVKTDLLFDTVRNPFTELTHKDAIGMLRICVSAKVEFNSDFEVEIFLEHQRYICDNVLKHCTIFWTIDNKSFVILFPGVGMVFTGVRHADGYCGFEMNFANFLRFLTGGSF